MRRGDPAYFKYIGNKKNEAWEPFPWQREARKIVQIPWPGNREDGKPYHRIYGLNCGRRAGKTTIEESFLWDGVLAPDDSFGPPNVRVTADTEEHGRKVWDRFINHLHNTDLRGLIADYSKERELVSLVTGATAQLLSANNPHALSGDSVTLWLIDEAQFITQAAWDNLFPSVAERNGVIVMFGVSEGEGPFREVCFKGDSDDYPEFKRLRYPTSANPLVPKAMIEFAKRTMSSTKYQQLYEALWVGEAGKIFRNVEGCITSDEIHEHPDGFFYTQLPRPGHIYYIGIDLGRLQDWTVATIWTRTGRLIAWDRFNTVSWEVQKSRLAGFSKLYGHPSGMVDSTGIGDPVAEDLSRLGLHVEGYQIATNTKKRTLIDELAIRIGGGLISYPRIPVFLEELNRMEARKSKAENSNIVTYSAPSGGTDDFVLSASLAQQLIPRFDRVQQEATDETPERQIAPWEAIA